MAEVLAKKKRIRAGHKASATKTMGKIDDILGTDSLDASTLSLLKLTLQEKLETIRVLDSEIVELFDDEASVTTEIEQNDGYRESIRSTLLKIDNALGKVATLPIAATATPSALATTSRVKLPKLKLRPFGGELTQWTSFWESFEAAVHNNPDLISVEKFNYLSSVVECSACEAISGLSLTASNYEEAISTLKKQFGGRQKIFDKHIDALLMVGVVTSCHDVKALRHLYDLASSHIRSLKSFEVKSDCYGTLLCPVLLLRLPSEMQLNVSRKVSEADWNLDKLMRVNEEEIVARERVSVARPVRRGDDKPPPTATALVSDTISTNVTCCYCGQPHFSTSCSVITDVEARKQSLCKSGGCFSCLRKGHLSRNCHTTNRYCNCSGRHHTSICAPRQQNNDRPTTMQTPPVPTIVRTSTLNPSASELNPSTPKSSLYVDDSQAVLLKPHLLRCITSQTPLSREEFE